MEPRHPFDDIFVFECQPAAHPDCTPSEDHLITGDFLETLTHMGRPAPAALVHADIDDKQASLALAATLVPPPPCLITLGPILAAG